MDSSSAAPRASHAPRRAAWRSLVVAGGALLIALSATGASAATRAASDRPAGAAGPGVSTDATATTLEGIDVSHWQGTINWSSVAAGGKKFAIIKATEDWDFVDDRYATNHAQAKAAGLWTGAYHFARPSTARNDAYDEANHFVDVMNLGIGDLIPALDLEVTGGLTVTQLQAWVTTFLGQVTARIGIKPMIYTSPAFWKKYMGDSRVLADAGYKTLWIAHWKVLAPTIPAANWGGRGWTFWQYDNCGTVPGISGCVDLDRFNGADLSTQAYSIFKIAAKAPTWTIKQGTAAATSVNVIRTNFTIGVSLDVAGLPEGTTATFDDNPVPDSSAGVVIRTPADPTVTPLGTYPVTITGSGGGMTQTTKVNLVIIDGTPPAVTVPYTGLISGRTIGTSAIPVRVSFKASDLNGIAATGLQRSINRGAWKTVKMAAATSLWVDQSLTNGSSVRQQSRATDRKGNTSAWHAGPLVRVRMTQQTSAAVTWSGSWRTLTTSAASGGSLRYATAAGASVTYKFTGTSVAWVSSLGTGRGSARVYIDGVYQTILSTWRSTNRYRSIVFAKNWGTVGTHTIKIVVVGTSGHPRVDVDAFPWLTLA